VYQWDFISAAVLCDLCNGRMIDSERKVLFLFSLVDVGVGSGIDDAAGPGFLNASGDAEIRAEINLRKVTGGQGDMVRAGALQLPSQLSA
jgi:hypothetical protein